MAPKHYRAKLVVRPWAFIIDGMKSEAKSDAEMYSTSYQAFFFLMLYILFPGPEGNNYNSSICVAAYKPLKITS